MPVKLIPPAAPNKQRQKDGFTLISFDEVQASEVSWLWHPYIPLGKITIIQGDPGCGKTTFVLALAAILTTGADFPTDSPSSEPACVIYQTAEDGLEDTIKPRLVQYGADCSKVKFLDCADTALTLDDDRIEKSITQTKAKMFVVDPIQAFLGQKVDMHRANEVRPLLHRLGQIAGRTGCAIVLIGHMNKSSAKGLYRGLGSVDIVAAARSVLLVGKHPENETVRCVVPIKSSLAIEGKSLAFTLDIDGFNWQGVCDMTASRLLNEQPQSQSAMDTAKNLLIKHCTDDLFPSTEMTELALANNISASTIKRAKKQLGVSSKKVNDLWYLTMPDESS